MAIATTTIITITHGWMPDPVSPGVEEGVVVPAGAVEVGVEVVVVGTGLVVAEGVGEGV